MRTQLLLLALGLVCLAARAVPADPTPATVTQPDGTKLTLVLHGDEFFHYTTTIDGYTVVKNEAGFYTYARLDGNQLVASKSIAHDASQRTPAELATIATLPKGLTSATMVQAGKKMLSRRNMSMRDLKADGHMDYSKFRGLIILVNYTDRWFTMSNPGSFYDDMVNTHDYTGYYTSYGTKVPMTGSVRDYYYDNSNQQFDPHFDVVGPVEVNFSSTAPNGIKDSAPIFHAALEAADDQVNYSDYDLDGDGTVDMVFFLVAGYGSNYTGNDSHYLWPHMFYLDEAPVLDGMQFSMYACSTGYAGVEYSSGGIAGIGTICHEFSHVLGLMDLYDADYANGGGQSVHPGTWSIMASGFNNNYGRNPVGYSLYERYALGFASPTLIAGEDSIAMQPLDESNEGYRLNTPSDNEFFLLENRQAGKWDKNLPGHGMLVTRVDSTDVNVWVDNKVNCDPNHMYYDMLRAYYAYRDSGSDPFPGTMGITAITNLTSPSLCTWSGQANDYNIIDIAEDGKVITFNVVRDSITSIIEDFETMPVADTTSAQGVTGLFAQWDFNACAVVDTVWSDVNHGHTVAMTNGSELHTSSPISLTPEAVRYRVYNPTETNANFQLSYSVDSGMTWVSPTEGILLVKAGFHATGKLSLPTDSPIMIKISQTVGDTEQPCYLDDVMLYYKGTLQPQLVMGDVDGNGVLNIADVTLLIDYLLNDEVAINLEAANVNGDDMIAINDLTMIIDMLLAVQ